jgi:hypothetical protein
MASQPASTAFQLPGETRAERVHRWRARADEIRAIADRMHDDSARDGLNQVAARLDVLAAWLEALPG